MDCLQVERPIIGPYKIIYTLTALCQPEECTLRIERIRFEYREGEDKEKYDAEEWISDKYALNKSKTKLVRGLAKWRRKTVDFTDTLFGEAANALSATIAQSNAKGNGNTEGNANTTGNTVITPKQEVTVKAVMQLLLLQHRQPQPVRIKT